MKLTPTVVETIAGYIRQGKSLSASANLAGISRASATQWKEKGRNSDRANIYKKFYEEINQAKIDYQQSLLDRMKAYAEEGERLKTIKKTTAPDGSITLEEKVSENNKYNATRWLLEKRCGFDSVGDRAAEKTLNAVIKILEKNLNPDLFLVIMEEVSNDAFLQNLEIETNLFIEEKANSE